MSNVNRLAMLALAAALAVAGSAQAEGGNGKGNKAKKGKPAQADSGAGRQHGERDDQRGARAEQHRQGGPPGRVQRGVALARSPGSRWDPPRLSRSGMREPLRAGPSRGPPAGTSPGA